MRTIASVQLDKRRPALVRTRQSKPHLLECVTAAPITSRIRGITSEVPVGPRNELDYGSVVRCDNVATMRQNAIGETIGLLFDDQDLCWLAASMVLSTWTWVKDFRKRCSLVVTVVER